MKVLIICSHSESLILFRIDLIKKLHFLNHEIHAAAPALCDDHKTTEFLHSLEVKTHSLFIRRTGLNPFHDFITFLNLKDLTRKIRPTHVLAYTVKPVIYGMFAAKLTRVPTRVALITGLGFGFVEKSEGLRRFVQVLLRLLYKMALSMATTVIFQNQDDLHLFTQLKLVNITKCRVVNGSGINLAHFQKSDTPGNDNDIHFLLIARLIKDKGIYEYVAAARKVQSQYPEAKFHLVGWQDTNPAAIDINQINDWVKEDIIEYHGQIDDVRYVIERSHVYVLPSYREGTPHTVLEAMAMGRPVITTNSPGCRETVIDGYNGFLIPIKAVAELAEAMGRFIIEPALIKIMGDRSRLIAEEKFDVHKVNNSILECMELTGTAGTS